MGKKILIVDDDRIIRDSLQELFTDAGFEVQLAIDGISGYELIAREKPDIIVTDILLPRMHGIALCEKLRASDDLKDIPIILMTGVYKDVNLRMYVYKGLADDFIEKPFHEKELLNKIEHFLGRGAEKKESRPVSLDPSPAGPDPAPHTGRSVDQDLDELINWAHK
jgi:DNA-binding response OmpR family regulator